MGAITSNQENNGSTSSTRKASPSIITFPDSLHLEESSFCGLVSSLQEELPSILLPDDVRVLPSYEMRVGEMTATKPVEGETDPVNIIRSIMREAVDLYNKHFALEEEKLVEMVLSVETEVRDSGMESRSEEKAEIKCNEVMEVKSDAEVDIELLHDLMQQMYDLHIKVNESRDWAQEKALQAARKVSSGFLELRTLRAKRQIEERMKKENKAKADEIGKLFADLDAVVKRNEGESGRAQMEAKRLEMENREMQAEIEAVRLEMSETDSKRKTLQKRLTRINKSAEMSERQMLVLQGEVEEAMKVNAKVEEQIEVVRKEIGASEAQLEEEKKLKAQAVKLVEAEHKATTSAKNSTQTRLTILTRKLDLDRRRHNEQVRSLRREISRLTEAASSSAHRKLAELCWPCMFCQAAESSVVFLPCAHQVLCAKCEKDHEDIESAKCPRCRVKVEERVFVYGLGA